MAKKRKYEDEATQEVSAMAPVAQVEQVQPESQVEQQPSEDNPEVENGETGISSFFLKDGTGAEFQFTRRPRLPKRSEKTPEGDIKVKVDGEDKSVWVTSSKGWSAPDKVVEYLWLEHRGVYGFLALDYNVPATDYNGMSFTAVDGRSERADPERVPKSQEAEDNRKAAAAKTLAEKKAATESEVSEEESEEETQE